MPYILLAVVLGALAVLQVVINRQIAMRWGLAPAVLLNASVLTAAAAVFYIVARTQSVGSFAFRANPALADLRWWWILPGLFGFVLVTCLPWATHHIGFQRVFVALVASQMATSVVWDLVVEKIPFTAPVGIAVVLAVVCVALVSMR